MVTCHQPLSCHIANPLCPKALSQEVSVSCRYSRYVIEDRWEAIRWAIGSAQTDDCVVIVGRGHKDYVDWRFGDDIARVSSSATSEQNSLAL